MSKSATDIGASTRGPRRYVLLAAAGALGLAAVPAQASVADFTPDDLETRCTGVAPPVTLPTKLVVPAGQTCLLGGTIVQGDVEVRPRASLIVEDGAELQGDLTVRVDGYVEVIEGTVQGQSQLRQSFGVYAQDSALGGVDVRNSGFFYADDSQVGDYLSRNSETSLASVWVEGGVDARGDLLSDLDDTVVTGSLTVQGSELGSVICNSEIDGPAEFPNNGGQVQIGGDNPLTDCGTNVFGDDLILRANNTADGTHVSNAIIRGDLVCTGNSPAPVGGDNRIRGEASGQCSDLQSASAFKMGAHGEAHRTADTNAKIKERSAQARQHAELLGPASIGS